MREKLLLCLWLQAKAEAEHKAEDDRLNAEAHSHQSKVQFAGSKLKLDGVGPLQAEVPTSVWRTQTT